MTTISNDFSTSQITGLIDCINRPFDFHPDGRVPDGNPNSTLQLVDYYDDNGVNSPIAQSGNPAITFDAVGIAYCFGQNSLRSLTWDTYTVTDRADAIYGPVYFFIDNTGAVINFPAISGDGLGATHTGYFWSNDPVNIQQIVGSTNDAVETSALVNALRVLSGGVRFWPTIELVTDSTTVAVSRYYGCQMTATSIVNAATQGYNFYSSMRNSPSYHEFSNSSGISGRFQPSQQGSLIKPLYLNSLDNLITDSLQGDGMYFPVLVARLTIDQSLTPNDTDSQSFPVRSYFRTILEGSLNQPTPLQATRVPFVPEWEDKVNHFAFRDDLYPTIVSGHSFKKVERAVVASMGKGSDAHRILVEAKKMYDNLAMAFRGGKSVVKTIKNAKKKSKNKKKGKKKKNNGNGDSARQQYQKVIRTSQSLQDAANAVVGPFHKMVASKSS